MVLPNLHPSEIGTGTVGPHVQKEWKKRCAQICFYQRKRIQEVLAAWGAGVGEGLIKKGLNENKQDLREGILHILPWGMGCGAGGSLYILENNTNPSSQH